MSNNKTHKKLKESVAYEDLGPAMVSPTGQSFPDYAKSVQKLTPPQAHPIFDAPVAPAAPPAEEPEEDVEDKVEEDDEEVVADAPEDEEGEEGKKEVAEADEEELDKIFTETMQKIREGDEEEDEDEVEIEECDEEEPEDEAKPKPVSEARKLRIKKMVESRKRRLREAEECDDDEKEPKAPVVEEDEEGEGDEGKPWLKAKKKEACAECDDEEKTEDGVVVREITEKDDEEEGEEKPKKAKPEADAPVVPDTGEDEKAMFAGETLPESFKAKATTIFRAAVARTVSEERKRLNRKFSRKMAEGFELMKGELSKKQKVYESKLTDKVDLYLSYVVENWMETNKIAVERGIRTELTEDFIRGLKSLFTEHYIEVPEEKIDVLKTLESKVTDLETKLNEQVDLNAKMRSALREHRKEEAIRKSTAGMAATQVEKFRGLTEGIEYTTKAEYEKRLATIRESYFKTSPKKQPAPVVITEESTPEPRTDSPAMDLYARTLAKTTRS